MNQIENKSIIDITSINEQVYTYIKENIINFNYPSGYKINVNQLSDILGVSTTPIKDALNRLTGEGLVEILSRAGTYVKSITENDIYEILQTRLFLETAVIEEIAVSINKDNLELLQDLYQNSKSLIVIPNDNESYKAFVKFDSQFHISFFKILGNQRLLQIYKNLNAHMQMLRYRLLNHALGKLPTTDEEHRMILEALCEHNVAKAKKAIANHIKRVDDICTKIRHDIRNSRHLC